MKKHAITIFSLFAISFFVLSCGCAATEKTTPEAAIKEFNETHDNSTVNAKMGDILLIKLEENPTTGYQWMLNYTDGFELIGDKYVQKNITGPGGEPLLGTGGIHEWQLKAVKTGKHVITGFYNRPWESAPHVKAYRLDVDIVAP
jgi:inhibitor of cysteine peptidase